MFRRISFTAAVFAGLAGVTVPAAADGLAVGGQIGTLGLGVNVAKEVNSFLALRVNANAGTFTMPSFGLYDTGFGGINYDVEADLKTIGLLADFHPLGVSPIGDGLVVTGGVYYNKNEFSASTGPVTADVGPITGVAVDLLGTISFDEFAPYLGVGYDGTFHSILPVAFFARAGVLFQGSPSVALADISGGGLVSQANLDAEAAQIEADLSNYEFYPVLTVGLSIGF